MKDRKKIYRPAYDLFIKLYPFGLDDLQGEVWRWIPDYEELYQESTYGRTKSFQHNEPRILVPSLDSNGYLSVSLHKNGKPKRFKVSRLVAITFIENPESKPQVDHADTVHFNNHVSNLRRATAAENTRYAYEAGLIQVLQGEEHPNAKLADEQILYIRENPDGLNTYELGEKFGVSQRTISDVQRGLKYKKAGGQIREPKRTILTAEQRIQIRQLAATGKYLQRELAQMFGCTWQTISKIIHENQK